MPSEKKNQVPILIALSAILLLAVLYSVKKSMSSHQAGAPAGQTQEASATEPSGAAEDARQPLASPEDADEGAQYHFVGNPPRDPFAPQMQGALPGDAHGGFIKPAPEESASSGRTRSSKGTRPGRQRSGSPGSLAPYKLKGLPDLTVSAPGASGGFGALPGSEPQPAYKATGVVRGREDIAILRGEGGSRYFVRQGQSVGDGYVVSMISPGGVVLKNKDRRIFLKLGGAQDAAVQASKSSDRPR